MVLQVHRGVYNAAEILYQRYLPMVEEQLASSPFAKVAFTVCGHISGNQSCCSACPLCAYLTVSCAVIPLSSAVICQYGIQATTYVSIPLPYDAFLCSAAILCCANINFPYCNAQIK